MASATTAALAALHPAARPPVEPATPVQAMPAGMVRPSGGSSLDSDASGSDPKGASEAMQELVDVLKTTTIGLRFEIDEKTHRVITQVIDKDTGEIIRQLPSEEVLRFARAIDKLQGLFVSHAV